jgi:acetyltransferase-like isoleucine patch superfamily enzyme
MKIKKIIQLLSTPLPSPIRRIIYNLMGSKIDKTARISAFSILVANSIILEAESRIARFCIVIGLNNVHLKAYSKISNYSFISGKNDLFLGSRAFIGSRVVIQLGAGCLSVGKYSAIAPRCSIYTHGAFLPYSFGYSVKNGDVNIGDEVWIMQNCSISPKVSIASYNIVLPGSTILKNISKSSMLKDDGIKRTEFPMAVVKKRLSNEDLSAFVTMEIPKYFEEYALKNKYSFEIFDSKIKLIDKDRIINIFLNTNDINLIENNAMNCYIGFNISSDLLNRKDIMCYDVLTLFHSDSEMKEFKDFGDYCFFHWGLKFANIKYKGIL